MFFGFNFITELNEWNKIIFDGIKQANETKWPVIAK